MAYADQQGMSSNRLVSIIIVILLHAFLGYALVTGLAFEAVQRVKEKLNVVDVKEEEPPEEEEPPPPPEKIETAPPPPTQTQMKFPAAPNASPPAPPPPPAQNYAPPSPGPVAPPPPPPPPKANLAKGAKASNSPGSWANSADYPDSEIRAKKEGTTGFRVTVGPNGRVTDCQVTSSSGSSRLDSIACQKIKSRARFSPALDSSGNPTTGSYTNSISWRLPKD